MRNDRHPLSSLRRLLVAARGRSRPFLPLIAGKPRYWKAFGMSRNIQAVLLTIVSLGLIVEWCILVWLTDAVAFLLPFAVGGVWGVYQFVRIVVGADDTDHR